MLEKDKADVPPHKEATVFLPTISIHGGPTSTPLVRISAETVFYADCNLIVSVWKIKGICNSSDNTRVDCWERGKSEK